MSGLVEKEENKSTTSKRDLFFVFTVTLIVYIFSVYLDLYEFVFFWSRKHDWVEVDELFIMTLALFPGLIWFSQRRWKEAKRALDRSLQMQAELEVIQQQQTETLDENRRLLSRISEVQELERKRIASDLHDIFGQHVTAIHANASTIKSDLDTNSKLFNIADKIVSSSQQLSKITRLILYELRPVVLEKLGLDAALSNLISDWKENNPTFDIDYTSQSDDEKLDFNVALIIYRIIQEGLTNIAKHSSANQVNLYVDFASLGEDESQNWVFIMLTDDGCGFSYPLGEEGLGLIGIRERVNSLNGSFEIITEPGKGTELSILIPKR